MDIFYIPLPDFKPAGTFSRLQHMNYALFLDSADQNHPDSRYSYIACMPLEMIEEINGSTVITNRNQQTRLDGNPFTHLKERFESYNFAKENIEDLPPFQGGMAGFWGYDLGRYVENLPNHAQANDGQPGMAIGIYDQVIAFDHKLKKTWLITQAENEQEAHAKRRPLFSLLGLHVPARKSTLEPPTWEAALPAEEYKNRIAKIIEYIHAGDVFQVNLAQQFDAKMPSMFDPFEHYCVMRETNPAPFSCYMNLGDTIISSASPERFLRTDEAGNAETRPIKGTRAKSMDSAQDALNREELLESCKDKAENVMIVDLLRNDMSKCCEADSIEVSELCKLETFAAVHHLVSTVHGKLREGQAPLDLLQACFPGGSITGAPKIRAMEIIDELEDVRRGPYCGSAGYISADGAMDTNILIRTLIYHRGNIRLQVGGGITAESDPQAEYLETLDKAEAIFQSFDELTKTKRTA